MYHNKKKMAMGGMNMPRVMKKNQMPGGGMVSPMEMGMGGKMEYGMGGRMDMGHGGDMARAIKIYLMKKGGKTFPDLTGDGKVTFADILKGRKVKLKKKSQAYGGKVMQDGGESDPPRADFLMRSPEIDSAISEEARERSQARSDRESAFGTSSTDVFMPIGNVPTLPERGEPEEMEVEPEDLAPIRRMGPRVIRRDMDRSLVGGMQDMPEQRQDSFTGFITAPYLRTGQVPTNIKVRNPETGQFEDRQMEPEEIADYIFKNQVRRRVPSQMMSREDAMKKAMQIMRSRS